MDINIDPLETLPSTSLDTSIMNPLTTLDKKITLSQEDKTHMYLPCKYSIVIKLQGKKILHRILKKKVQDMWKIKEKFPLIDLGEDYNIAKLQNKDNIHSIMQNGP